MFEAQLVTSAVVAHLTEIFLLQGEFGVLQRKMKCGHLWDPEKIVY